MNEDFHRAGGVVIYLPDLDFSFIVGKENGIDECTGGFAIRYLIDDECFLVKLIDPCAYPDLAPALPVVVLGTIGQTAGREIG